LAQESWGRVPSAIVIPEKNNQATQFIAGIFSHKSSIYVDPYSGEITGKQQVNETDMFKIRKLHGELLMGSFGTKIVELTASWMIVLILTGVYLFWPRSGWRGLFRIRFNSSRQILFRDLHTVTGFLFSALLLLILAGGLPWTDVFGRGFKKIQNATESGYPDFWSGNAFSSEVNGTMIPLDNMVTKAIELDLAGEVQISPPQAEDAVYTISNETSSLSEICIFHFDAYSGELLHKGTWDDIGSMMKARLWVMAFHQGEFGFWNWLLVLFTAIALFLLSLFAIVSYLGRRSSSGIEIPSVPDNYRIGKGMLFFLSWCISSNVWNEFNYHLLYTPFILSVTFPSNLLLTIISGNN